MANRQNLSFADKVAEIVRMIPVGQTMTYKQVAAAVGQPRAYRAVGNILNRIWQTDKGKTVPCHRVVRSDGSIGGYAAGAVAKIQKLRHEGIRC